MNRLNASVKRSDGAIGLGLSLLSPVHRILKYCSAFELRTSFPAIVFQMKTADVNQSRFVCSVRRQFRFILYHSIALEKLFQTSFGSNVIWLNAKLKINWIENDFENTGCVGKSQLSRSNIMQIVHNFIPFDSSWKVLCFVFWPQTRMTNRMAANKFQSHVSWQ